VPVLLVPGNHERSRLPYPLLALQDGLHLFERPRTVVLEARGVRVAFAGFPFTHQIRRRFAEVLAAAAARETDPADVRVLCMHQCVEGATCGPRHFTFRFGDDVIRAGDLPRDVAVTLCGHIHRHQVLRPRGQPPVIYAGSIERTSFAEAPETKGYVVLELARSGLGPFQFRPLPTRPMVARTLSLDGIGTAEALARVYRFGQGPEPRHRYHAAVGLGLRGDPAQRPRMEDLLKQERDPKVMSALRASLTRIAARGGNPG